MHYLKLFQELEQLIIGIKREDITNIYCTPLPGCIQHEIGRLSIKEGLSFKGVKLLQAGGWMCF